MGLVMEEGEGVEEFKLFLGLVTLCRGMIEILHLKILTSTGWLECFCFWLVFVFGLLLFFGLVDFGGFCCDHAGEVYLTEPLEWGGGWIRMLVIRRALGDLIKGKQTEC